MTAPGDRAPQPPYGTPTMPVPPQYPPVPPPGYAYAPPAAPPVKRGMPAWGIVLIALGGALVVIVLVIVGIGVVVAGGGTAAKPSVRITSCTTDSLGLTTLSYALVNHDSRAHDYTVRGSVGNSPTVPDFLVHVAPGATADGQMVGTGSGTCEITGVDQH